MKIRLLAMVAASLLSGFLSASAALIVSTGTQPAKGNGNSGSPYEIWTAEELRWFVHYENTRHWFPNDHAKLMADINLSSICGPEIGSWIPLGHTEESGASGYWKGKLYGNGYTISGMYIDCNDLGGSATGFCGDIDGVTITDLTLKGRIINAKGNVGSLAGQVTGGSLTISNCVSYVDMSTEAFEFYGFLGGLIGYIYSGSGNISRCSYQGTITGHVTTVGSLIARHYGSTTVKECSGYSGGTLGLIGATNTTHTIQNCISDKYTIYDYNMEYHAEKRSKLRDNIFVDKEYCLKDDAITPDTEGCESVEPSHIANGGACYKMNQKMGGQYFTQNIGTDLAPIPGSSRSTVYRVKRYTQCGTDKWEWTFSNTDEDDTTLREHTFDADHAYCTRCGEAVNPDYSIAKDAEGYYLAASGEDIKWLWKLVNVTGITDANIRLTADIDMQNEAMEPLALFAGVFDGGGHTLSNINISCSGVARVGLVGKLTGAIRNLTLTGSIEGSYATYIGAFAAYVWKNASISKVRNDCTVKATGTAGGDVYSYIGGVAGYSDGSITYAINNGPVVDASVCTGTLKRYIAGVAGYAIPYTEVSHLANNGVVGAFGAAQFGQGAPVVNVSDASYYSDSYYVAGISNPGLDFFFCDMPTATDTRVSPVDVGSGKLAWLLSGKDYDAHDSAAAFFGQSIGADMVPYPFVSESHKGVYNARHYYTCDSYTDYSNSPADEEPLNHTWNESHYCSVCFVIDPACVEQDAATKAYLIDTAGKYDTFVSAVNGAYLAGKPMQFASASIQSDLDFSPGVPAVISRLSGRIHGNGHKMTLGSALSIANIANTVSEDGIIEYLDVEFPATGFYPMVYSNLGRIAGCNVTRGIPAAQSAGLVMDCSGELPESHRLFGRHTRCLIKILTIDGPANYRLYSSNVAADVEAPFTAISIEQGASGELAYTLSHGSGNCEWGQLLGTDTDPRIYFGQTPASGTFVTRLTSYAAEHQEGIVEYMNAGMDIEASPGCYKVCDDTQSWATHPSHNFIISNADGTYTADVIKLEPAAAHHLPFEVEAASFLYDETLKEGEVASLMFPIDIPVSKINGTVYLLSGYDATAGELEYVTSDELTVIPANVPFLVKAARQGEILTDGSYSEAYDLPVAPMTGANAFTRSDISHMASYHHETIPASETAAEDDTVTALYYTLSGTAARQAAPARATAAATATALTALPVDAEGATLSPFAAYFSIPASLVSDASRFIPVVLKEEIVTGMGDVTADTGSLFPCEIWSLDGIKLMTAASAADLSRLAKGIYIAVSPTHSRKITIP